MSFFVEPVSPSRPAFQAEMPSPRPVSCTSTTVTLSRPPASLAAAPSCAAVRPGSSVLAWRMALIAVSALAIPHDVFLQTMNTYHHPSRIVFIHDDATGTVTVHDLPDGLHPNSDGYRRMAEQFLPLAFGAGAPLR